MYTGQDIRDLRYRLGISQVEMAEKIGTTVHSIRYWEQNTHVQLKHKYNQAIRSLIEENAYQENEEKVEKGFFKKVKENIARIPFLRDVVALYYASLDPKTPPLKKATAIAALAYFIIPFDAIPDMIPIAGFTDDAAMIAGAIAALGALITQEHREQAEEWLQNL